MKLVATVILNLSFCLLSAQNTPVDSIPFKLEKDNRIYTYLKVNETDSLYFLLDTGASDMVINSEALSKVDMAFNSTANNMGATGENQVELSTNNTITWGKHKISGLEFIAIPYPNDKWDGVLGLSALMEFVMKIDYDKMQIHLFDKDSFRGPNQEKLRIDYVHGVPVVDVKVKMIDNTIHDLRLEIDTGSDRVIDISTRYVDRYELLDIYPKAFATSTVRSSDGSTGKILNHYFPAVIIAGYELYKIPGGLAQIKSGVMNIDGIDGIIGNWFLKRFNLTFDFKNDYLYFEPNNHLYTPFYDFLTK